MSEEDELEEEKKKIKELGLEGMSDAGFARLSEGRKKEIKPGRKPDFGK
ncbi:MAG: hypothetical protein ACFFCS_10640 [Candidatus Hodarchaeota archaeon]